jgi:hypothetical protein
MIWEIFLRIEPKETQEGENIIRGKLSVETT